MLKREEVSYAVETAELNPVDEVSEIKVPLEVAESSGITPYVFTSRFMEAAGLKEIELHDDVIKGKRRFEYADLAKNIASDSEGAPVLGTNWVRIWIDDKNPNAGSEADYIWMYFGRNKRIKLWGERNRFPKGRTLTWNLNLNRPYLENVHTDLWDQISLVNPSNDGIKIKRIQIVHSSETILDWNCGLWLDGSKLEMYGRLGLAAKILETKLDAVGNTWVPQIYWAAQEIGKTDCTKYGTGNAWCSEFASWCLRKVLWDTPVGDFGSGSMEDYFNRIGRKYTKDDLLDGSYRLITGDYLRFPNHSALFIEYLGDPADPKTKMKTIDGNTSSTVGVRNSHRIGSLLSVGCTR